VWDQKLESFLALHENAFRNFGGVPSIVRHDNMKAAVVRACFYDPEINPVWAAFAQHWGFTALPTLPRNPKENGKQERSGGYVKSNALKGRRFDSLQELNAFLVHWNRTWARVRIHGTTRRQVFAHFEETDKKALQPLAASPFAFFSAARAVHPVGRRGRRRLHRRRRTVGQDVEVASTGTWYASSVARRRSRSTPASSPVSTLASRAARKSPAPASAPSSRICSRAASGWERRSSSGPKRPTRSAVSAPCA
jgi:hypothetical protein